MIKSNKQNNFCVSEPNFIPLLDFMLVLVIMFVMLAGPIQNAIKLPVPEVKQGTAKTIDKKSILISIKGKNNIYIGNQHFDSINAVEKYLKTKSQAEITIAIDKTLEVDLLMKLFAISKSLGISTANIQVENEALD
jgi:biopolymer transport protein ExbD